MIFYAFLFFKSAHLSAKCPLYVSGDGVADTLTVPEVGCVQKYEMRQNVSKNNAETRTMRRRELVHAMVKIAIEVSDLRGSQRKLTQKTMTGICNH